MRCQWGKDLLCLPVKELCQPVVDRDKLNKLVPEILRLNAKIISNTKFAELWLMSGVFYRLWGS
ncbi:MAG: hypothetical protein ACQERH_06900 [Acidobacteriota bacterium]